VVEGRVEGQLFVFSGATGNLLYAVTNPGADEPYRVDDFGRQISRLADVSGDGIDDFIVGAVNNRSGGLPRAGQALVFSGADGALVRTVDSPNPVEEGRFGSRIAAFDDLTGDAYPEYAVCCSDGAWIFYSGADGAAIMAFDNPPERGAIHYLGPLDDGGRLAFALGGHDGAFLRQGAPNPSMVSLYAFPAPDSEPLEVTIDFMPRGLKNVINVKKQGRFWVAVLSGGAFDAVQVDPSTVELGPGHAAPDRYRVKDIDGDGAMDQTFRFRTPAVGIACGDKRVKLGAETYAGEMIYGTDDIRVIGCR
jgi:hypothetical protein